MDSRGPVTTEAPDTTTIVRAVVTLEVYPAGSLPSPDALREYDQIVPGVAERWMDTFLSETTHRRDRERESDRTVRRAQRFALTIMLAALLVTIYAISQHQGIGQALGFGSVATLGYVFLKQRTRAAKADDSPS